MDLIAPECLTFQEKSDAQGPGTRPREEKEEAAEATRGAAAAVARADKIAAYAMLKLCAALALVFAFQASAQPWPAKTVRVVVTLAPGSATDILARTLSERLSRQLGQPVIVENRPGASTTLGAALVAKAEPDGHTLLVTSSAHTVAPFLYPSVGYDATRDLAAVAPLANLPTVLVVPASRGYRSVHELVAAARAKPGSINYASAAAS